MNLPEIPISSHYYSYEKGKYYEKPYTPESPSRLKEIASFDYSSLEATALFEFNLLELEANQETRALPIPIKINQRAFKFHMLSKYSKKYKIIREHSKTFETQKIGFVIQSKNDFGLFKDKDEEIRNRYSPNIELSLEITVGLATKYQPKVVLEREYSFQVKTNPQHTFVFKHPSRTNLFLDVFELYHFLDHDLEEEILQIIEAQLKPRTPKRMKLDRVIEKRIDNLQKEDEKVKEPKDIEEIKESYGIGKFMVEYKGEGKIPELNRLTKIRGKIGMQQTTIQ